MKPLQNYIEEEVKKFDTIIRNELSGILAMNSEERFDMCERILNNNGKVKTFLSQSLHRIAEIAIKKYKKPTKVEWYKKKKKISNLK